MKSEIIIIVAFLVAIHIMFKADFSNKINTSWIEPSKSNITIVVDKKTGRRALMVDPVYESRVEYIPKGCIDYRFMDEHGLLGIQIVRYYRHELDWDTEGVLR